MIFNGGGRFNLQRATWNNMAAQVSFQWWQENQKVAVYLCNMSVFVYLTKFDIFWFNCSNRGKNSCCTVCHVSNCFAHWWLGTTAKTQSKAKTHSQILHNFKTKHFTKFFFFYFLGLPPQRLVPLLHAFQSGRTAGHGFCAAPQAETNCPALGPPPAHPQLQLVRLSRCARHRPVDGQHELLCPQVLYLIKFPLSKAYH